MADGERTQEGKDAVARQRLQDPRRSEERGQRGRERRRDDPRVDQRGQRGHPAHGTGVADERLTGDGRREHDRGRDVDDERHAYGEEGPARQAAARVLQVARHAHPLREARHGGEEHGEDDPESVIARRHEVPAQQLRVPRSEAAHEEPGDGDEQHAHDHELEARGPVRAQPGHEEQRQHGGRGHRLHETRACVSRDVGQRLTEADGVEAHRDRLRQEQHQTERGAVLDAQRSRDQVVVAAALDAQVGRDRGERDARQDRDRVGQQDDQQRPRQPGRSDHGAEPQEQDDPEDRQDAGREDTGERPQSSTGGAGRVSGIALCVRVQFPSRARLGVRRERRWYPKPCHPGGSLAIRRARSSLDVDIRS